MKNRWQGTTIDEVCDITSSKRIYRADYAAEGVPFYRGKEIIEKQRGVLDVSMELFISEEKFQAIEEKFGAPHPGDLLLTSVGTLGVPYIVQPGERFYFKDGNLTWFRNLRNIDNGFLYYWLLSPIGKAQLGRSTIGSSQPALTIVLLKQMEIDLPNFPTQRKIASILSAYDDLIENNLRRIKILEEMSQTLYREWFVKFRFPGHEKARIVDSTMGKIPEGWEVNKVGGLLKKIKRKKRVKKQNYELDAAIPVVDQGRDFIGGYTSDLEALHDNPLPIIVFGDHTRILKYVGFPFACGADGTQLLLPNTERMPTSLFFYALRSIDLSDFAYARHFKFLKEQGILVPDEQVAQSFAQVADPIRGQIRCLLRRNATLRRTRDLLLPKLISGELDVSDLDIKTGGYVQ